MKKIDFNKKMIGKDVIDNAKSSQSECRVVDVIGDDTLIDKNKKSELHEISIYDIRSK